MIKRGVSIVLGVLLCVVSSPVFAQVKIDEDDWEWVAEIETGDAPAGYVRLELTPAVLDAARSSLSDLRIAGMFGTLVPHVISTPLIRPAQIWTPSTLMNRTYTEGDFARATVAFGRRVRKNHVRVTLSGNNYRRFAMLEGSEDSASWATIDTAWLFHFRDGGRLYDALIFRFPLNDFPYLRLTAYNMEDEPERIEIISVETSVYSVDESEGIPVDIVVTPVDPEEDEGNVTLFDIDTGFRNLPLRSLSIETFTPYFHRRFELLGRDAITETYDRVAESAVDTGERPVPWTSIRNGVFHRIARDGRDVEHVTIEGLRRPYRYLRLRILNGDDAPLDLAREDIRVTRRPLSSLVFELRLDAEYDLYFGNPKATAPNYDLGRAIEAIGSREMASVTVGEIMAFQGLPEPPPTGQRYKWLIRAVLIVAVAVMGGLILSNLRRVKPE